MTTCRVQRPQGRSPITPALPWRQQTAQEHRQDLSTRVQRLVQYRLNADRIRYRVEREFPLVNATPAQRRAFREYLARLIVRYRHGR